MKTLPPVHQWDDLVFKIDGLFRHAGKSTKDIARILKLKEHEVYAIHIRIRDGRIAR